MTSKIKQGLICLMACILLAGCGAGESPASSAAVSSSQTTAESAVQPSAAETEPVRQEVDYGQTDLWVSYLKITDADGNTTVEETTSYYPNGARERYRQAQYSYDGGCTVYEDEYNEEEQVVRHTLTLPDGSLAYYTLYEYDDNGNCIKESSYNEDGTQNYDEGQMEYRLDDRGNIIWSRTAYGPDDFTTCEYEFNEQNKCVKSVEKDAEDNITFLYENHYAENGMDLEWEDCWYGESADGNYRKDYEYTPDDQGGQIITTRTTFAADNKTLTDSVVRVDCEGKELYRKNYDENGDLSEIYEYTYDAQGQIVRTHVTNAQGETVWSECWQYQQDEQGNIIRQEYYNDDGSVNYSFSHDMENFNSYGQAGKTIYYNEDGTVNTVQECFYNEKGWALGMQCLDSENKYLSGLEYTIDEENNQLERIEYGADKVERGRTIYEYVKLPGKLHEPNRVILDY